MALDFRELGRYLARPPGFGPAPETITPDHAALRDALERHKREGGELGFRARLVIMGVIAVLILFITPWPAVLYYEALIALFVLIGVAQRHVGSVGQNRWELLLLFADLALMTIICLVPNPLDDRTLPLAFQYRFDTFLYFFTILAGATLAYSWQTVFAVGTWTVGLWTLGALGIWAFRDDPGPLRAEVEALYGGDWTMVQFLDPTAIMPDLRVQEAVVFLIVAGTLAVSMRRFTQLLVRQAGLERERANLARYFSPNVVEALSHNDEPLREVRAQDVAVLFVDIVGFTRYAADRAPEEVIETLRAFHARMERAVFAHGGTLDKYLGDGLMATFGTPLTGPRDALNALTCAHEMARALDAWNAERAAAGSGAINVSFGLHHGPVVLGDIGANRLEYAVIGNTVNVASRLEALTRPLGVRLVASAALVAAARAVAGADHPAMATLRRHGAETLRGLDDPVEVWTAA